MSERYYFHNSDIYDGDKRLCDTDITDRLNEQEDDNDRLLKINADLRAACEFAFDWLGRFGEYTPIVTGGETELQTALTLAASALRQARDV